MDLLGLQNEEKNENIIRTLRFDGVNENRILLMRRCFSGFGGCGIVVFS